MANKISKSDNAVPSERIAAATGLASRRERRRTETRDKLYSAAVRLLSDHEFDSVTVEMITEAAEVGKGTFFNYFSNKESVVSYHFESQLRILTETLKTAAEGSPMNGSANRPEFSGYAATEGGPCWRKIIGIVHESAERRHKQKHFTRTLLALSLTNPQVRAANLEFRGRILDAIRGLIVEAQEHGEIRTDAPPDAFAVFMFSTYLGALYVWSQSDSDENLHEVIDRTYARVWSGIRQDDGQR